METLWQDVKYGVRQLAAQPAFTLVAVLTLALGIGANLAIFRTVDALFLKTLPVHQPEQLVQVHSSKDGDAIFSTPLWEEMYKQQSVFAGAFAWAENQFNLARSGEIRRAEGVFVSGDYFSTLGLTPHRGRLLSREDDRRGGNVTVAVLNFDFWQREYGAREDILGQQIYLDGHPFQIVGIAPRGFFGMTVGARFDVAIPMASEPIVRGANSSLDEPAAWWLRVAARLRPEISMQQADAQLQTIAAAAFEQAGARPRNPDEPMPAFKTASAATGVSGLRLQYAQALWVLMGIVSLVLLIACANVANLLLARSAARRREMGVRLALGASRTRLVRQLLTESFLLAIAGTAIALPLAVAATRILLLQISTQRAAAFLDFTPDWRTALFVLGTALLTTLLFGLAPSLGTSRVSLANAMAQTGPSASDRRSRFGFGSLLVVGQVAISMVLAGGAALLLRTFYNLTALDIGFESQRVLLAPMDLSQSQSSPESREVLYRELLDRIRRIPGVSAASQVTFSPLSGFRWAGPVEVPGYEPKGPFDSVAAFNSVSAGYFAAMGTGVVAGREFTDQDTRNTPRVAVINEAFAKKFFPGTNPVGRQYFQRDGRVGRFSVEIVGVVKDAKFQRIREETRPTSYVAAAQRDAEERSVIVVRARSNPAAAIPDVRAAFAEIAPQAYVSFRTMESYVGDSLRQDRLLAILSGFFGSLALLLSAIGLYGLLAHMVARRRREIGIRMALGSTPSLVLRLFVGYGMRLVVVGVLIGATGTYFATRVLSTFLFGVTERDPLTLGAAAIVLMAVAAAATASAARHAARINPCDAIRYE